MAEGPQVFEPSVYVGVVDTYQLCVREETLSAPVKGQAGRKQQAPLMVLHVGRSEDIIIQVSHGLSICIATPMEKFVHGWLSSATPHTLFCSVLGFIQLDIS